MKLSLDELLQLNLAQLERMDMVTKPINHEIVQLQAGQAAVVRYQLRMNTPDGKAVALAVTQFLFLGADKTYLITAGTTADQSDKYAPVFVNIGKSFRLIP